MHTSHTPEDWFTPIDVLPAVLRMILYTPAVVVDEMGGGMLMIPDAVHVAEDGQPTITCVTVQEYAPSGRRVDRYQRLMFPCACGNHLTAIEIGVN
jgi:hypothetical protein